jgi:hypothetical protein
MLEVALWIFNPSLGLYNAANGMETALVLVLFAASLTRPRLVPLLFLARTDAVIYAPVLLRRDRVAWAGFLLALALVVGYNLHTTGYPQQISGAVKAAMPYHPAASNPYVYLAAIAPPYLWPFVVTAGRPSGAIARAAACSALLLAYYFAAFGLLVRPWYFAIPAATATALAWSSLRRRPRVVQALVVALCVAHTGYRIHRDETAPQVVGQREMAAYLRESGIPSDTPIGCWNAGVISYVSGKRVVNLDGLVNSAEIVPYIATGAIWNYLDAKRIDWIVDYDINPAPNVWRLEHEAAGGWRLYKRKGEER